MTSFPLPGRLVGRAVPLLVATALAVTACGGSASTEDSSESTAKTQRNATSLSTTETRDMTNTTATTASTTGDSPLTSPSKSTSSSDKGLFFPRHKKGEVPAALAGGKLVLDHEGCIRLVTAGNRPGATLIWPPAYAARTEGGEIRILDEGGQVVARVGDEVRIGGGFIRGAKALEGISGVDEQTKRELIERCPGSYYYAAPYVRPDQ
jgi:hypothetical protein